MTSILATIHYQGSVGKNLLSVVNAMVLYFKIHPELAEHCKAHKAFRQTLVHQLVQHLLDAYASPEVMSPPGLGRRHISNEMQLKGKHFPETSNRQRCVVCAYKQSAKGVNKSTSTKTYCSKCEKHMCKNYCFAGYHSKSQY